jgi:hypothetical protein
MAAELQAHAHFDLAENVSARVADRGPCERVTLSFEPAELYLAALRPAALAAGLGDLDAREPDD